MQSHIITKALLIVALMGLTACGPRTGAGAGGANDPLSATNPQQADASDPSSPAYFQRTIGDRVLFPVDQSSLTSEARATLDGQAQWLINNPDVQALIEGHADEQGTREYNIALSARRAEAVRAYLIERGVASNRLSTVPYGKERPAELCSEESCYRANRRAVTVLRLPGLA